MRRPLVRGGWAGCTAALALAALVLTGQPASAAAGASATGATTGAGRPAPVDPRAAGVQPHARAAAQPRAHHNNPNPLLRETLAEEEEQETDDPALSALCQDFITKPNPYHDPAPNVDQINGDTTVPVGSQAGCSAAQNETTIAVNPHNPRNLVAGANDWAATERLTAVRGMHPVEANWRLAAAAGNRPVLGPGDAPTLHPPEAVRAKAIARWPAFIGGGRRPLVLIPGGGGWSSGRSGHSWPAERFAVVANQATAERVILLSGVGDERVVRETRGGIAKQTTVVKLADMTVDEVAVLSELSLAVIGHDGDALHVAAAAGSVVLAVASRPDIPPMGQRVVALWAEDFTKFPARHVVAALSRQARIDTYA